MRERRDEGGSTVRLTIISNNNSQSIDCIIYINDFQ